ncbi:hypothetical protein CLOACE_04730 [Clostridium acetireducens DSM 10703]|uniref:Uncharacterized protein n=1 Tax=Clostridium acetireducens DSM 10703 TaxID=1121290 RepID=A0A1E8F0V7_9CLOT|nr:WYL domain-containing protein [Clostridium acetireducens]OFI07068.1 hypothetical protein CLOACE_04730 [Clostridium acetireducens DSM 10703]
MELMNSLNNLYRVINFIGKDDESKTFKEICENLSISKEDLFDILDKLLQYKDFNKVDILITDRENTKREIFDVEDMKENTENLDFMVFCTSEYLDKINVLNNTEIWVLYDFLKTCNNSFIENAASKIIKFYENSKYEDFYKIIKNRRVIKQYLDIFELDEKILLDLYKAINHNQCIKINLNNGSIIYDVSPIKVFFDDDTNNWYLHYGKRKRDYLIKINKVKSIQKCPNSYKKISKNNYTWGFSKHTTIVKVRIYNEKNAIEIAHRYLLKKDILKIDRFNNYLEYTIKIGDENLFLRWARSLGAQLVILKPDFLRKRIIEDILKWEKLNSEL